MKTTLANEDRRDLQDLPARTALRAAIFKENQGTASPREYEDLDGGQGRAVFFRPQRYRPSDLGLVEPTVVINIEGTSYGCSLFDVSQNGAAFEVPPELPMQVGDFIPSLTVSFDRYDAYHGEARVGSVREDDGRRIAGVSFVDSLMNIDDVLQLRDVKACQQQTEVNLVGAHRPWSVEGLDTFKSRVAEFRLFLEDADVEFAKFEAALPWSVVHGDTDSPARTELIAQIRDSFVPEFIRYTEEIDEALRLASPAESDKLKEFSLRHVHEFFMRAPFMHRCRTKPLGYPGDFEVMRYLYERQFEGQTLLGKAIHLATVHTRGACAVRNRKDLVKDRIREAIAAHKGSSKPLRIVSVAAGPAQESFELVGELGRDAPEMELVLFDQDKQALSFAHARLSRLAEETLSPIKIIFLHDSIKRLLGDPGIFSEFGPFQVVFAAGLFDYLRFPTAARLSGNLYKNLAPGGTAYIGNMVPTNPCRWFLEHHLEWFLLYRTREEILEFGRAAAPDAELGIVEEPTGVNPFLSMRRS